MTELGKGSPSLAATEEAELIQRFLHLRLDNYRRDGAEFIPLDEVRRLISAIDELSDQLEVEKDKTAEMADELRETEEELGQTSQAVKELVKMVLHAIESRPSDEAAENRDDKVGLVLSFLRKVPGRESEASRKALETLREPQFERIFEELEETYNQLSNGRPWIEEEGQPPK